MGKRKGLSYWDKKLIGVGGVVNEYVKLRDAVDFDEDGKPIAPCITCGKRVSRHNLQAGHFVSRRHKLRAYDERNIHAQCGGCNKFGKGETLKYRKVLIELYGEEVVEELEQAQYQTANWKPYQLEELYGEYKEKIKRQLYRECR